MHAKISSGYATVHAFIGPHCAAGCADCGLPLRGGVRFLVQLHRLPPCPSPSGSRLRAVFLLPYLTLRMLKCQKCLLWTTVSSYLTLPRGPPRSFFSSTFISRVDAPLRYWPLYLHGLPSPSGRLIYTSSGLYSLPSSLPSCPAAAAAAAPVAPVAACP